MTPESFRQVAFNPATESENRIHADDVAKQYGFRGGLVPGVTVFAYLAHPAVVAWGRDWLERGWGRLTLPNPLYDGDDFAVEVSAATDTSYDAAVRSNGIVTGQGSVALEQRMPDIAARRGNPLVPSREDRPAATRAALEALRDRGVASLDVTWNAESEQARYLADFADMAALVRPDGEGLAHPAFVLCLANWILARNVLLGPWIHVESEMQNHAVIRLGQTVHVEADVVDLFEKKGHEFVDLDVRAYLDDDTPVMRAKHRAIYVLRGQ